MVVKTEQNRINKDYDADVGDNAVALRLVYILIMMTISYN